MRKRHNMRNRAQGLSLIELMIAMTLGLLVIGAVGWVYLGTTQTYRTQDALARIQENARYAFEVMSNDLRMTGTTGCAYQDSTNVLLNYTTDWYKNLIDQPMRAQDSNGVAGTMTQYSDALMLVRADVTNQRRVQTHNAGTAEFTFAAAHNFMAGDLLVATDCNHVAIFQATAVGSTTTLSHTQAYANTTANLGSGGPYTYSSANDSRVFPLIARGYYVATNAAGEKSLYRTRPTGTALTLSPEELIEGVDDMQLTFGVDTDATADGAPNSYLTATQINTAGTVPGATAQERWARVVSVRISLLMRSVENNVVPGAQTYTFGGTSSTAADRRLRKAFTHVVNLRN